MRHIQVIPDSPFPRLLLEDDVTVALADDIDATGCGKRYRRCSSQATSPSYVREYLSGSDCSRRCSLHVV